mgnify:CR=1 FL=1
MVLCMGSDRSGYWSYHRTCLLDGVVMKQLDEVEDKIDQRIYEWHRSSSTLPLAAYLGWSDAEYRAFVERNEIPEREYGDRKRQE